VLQNSIWGGLEHVWGGQAPKSGVDHSPSIFAHEPTDVEMKQTSTVFCPISPHKAPN